jgi:hypothetical protein
MLQMPVLYHQPLVHIFKPEKRISSTASARIQRYATFLSGYEYEIVFSFIGFSGS